MKILYYHGGPGFNSNPEKNVLLNRLRESGIELLLWNEPSLLRPQGQTFKAQNAFQNYLECAEQFLLANYSGEPIVLMGHSFGANPVCYLTQRHPEKLARVIIISSDLSPADADRNIFQFTMMDFQEFKDERSLELENILANYTGKFDANTENGFALAAQNPRLFNYYWMNKERMGSFLSFYAEPGFGVDLDSFFGVRRSFFASNLKNSSVPALAIFGKHDIVISQEKELSLLRQGFSSLEVLQFEESAHYPHIEETDRFLAILTHELDSLSDQRRN